MLHVIEFDIRDHADRGMIVLQRPIALVRLHDNGLPARCGHTIEGQCLPADAIGPRHARPPEHVGDHRPRGRLPMCSANGNALG